MLGLLGLCSLRCGGFTDEQKTIIAGLGTQLGLAFHGLRQKTEVDAQRIENQNLYQTIFEHTGTGVWVVESDGTISFANRVVESLTGYTQDEIGARRWEEFFARGDIPKMRRYRRARLRSGHAATRFPARLVGRSGRTRTVLMTPGLIPGTGRLIVSMIDITAQKRAEEDRLRLNECLQGIIDNANVLVVLMDRRGRVRVWNRAAELITGYSADEIVGRGAIWRRLAPYEVTGQAAQGLIDRVYSGEALDDLEASIITRTGEARLVSWYAKRLVDHEGRLVGVVILGRDLTSHREMEEKKLEAESRAEHAERLAAIGEMAAGVAHQINNPLTGVLGLAELLSKEEQTPIGTEYLSSILEGGRRIARIVDGLLAFAGRHELTQHLVSVNECIRRAMDSQAANLLEAQISVSRHLVTPDPLVAGDAVCLEQVFCNILANATDELGGLDYERRLLVRSRLIGDLVAVEFQDNGRGIPRSHLRKIFDPFFTTKEPGKGIGLGLSICHGLVAQHGGRIYAHNNAGVGATFVVELPFVRP